MIFFGGTSAALELGPSRIVGEVLAVATLGAWLTIALVRPSIRPRSTLVVPILAVLSVLGLSALQSSNTRIGLEYLGYGVLLVGLYLFLVQLLGSRWFAPRMTMLLETSCVLVAGGYVVVVAYRWVDWWNVVGRLTLPPLRPEYEALTLGNPTVVGTLAVVLLPTIWAFHESNARPRTALTALTALVLLTVVLTGSRATLLALAFASAVWVGFPRARGVLARLPSLRGRSTHGVRSRQKVIGFVAAGLLAVLTVPTVVWRLIEGGGIDLRFSYAAASLRMFLDHPITGVGPGMWGVLRASYTQSTEVDYYLPQAHNLPLQAAAEFGALAFVGGAIIVAWSARLIAGALDSADPHARAMARAAGFALTFMAIQELFDPFATQPTVLFAVATPLAWLDAHSTRPAFGRRATLACLIAVLTTAGGLGAIEQAGLSASLSVDRLEERAVGDARGPALAAIAADPSLPVYKFNLGIIEADAGNFEAAAAALGESAKADDFAEAWLDLGAVDVERGQLDEARMALHNAMRLGWQQPAVCYAAGFAYVALGDREDAVMSFGAAIAGATTLGEARFWTAAIAPLREAAIDKALSLAESEPSTDFEIDVLADRYVAASGQAARVSGDGQTIDNLILAAWQGDRSAYEQLLASAQAQPLDTKRVGWLARLARRAGDNRSAARFAEWLDLIDPVVRDYYGREIAIAVQNPDWPLIRGANAAAYGPAIYHRLVAPGLFVGWLPRLAYPE